MREAILIVDKDPAARRFLLNALKPEGYQVRQAATALEAMMIAARSSKPFDLVLTEVALYGIDGVKLADKLSQAFPATRVIYVTGEEVSPETPQSERLVLTKPVEAEQLLATVRGVLAAPARKGPARPERRQRKMGSAS
jgi:DNA-binding NtrC family response regulator